MKFSTGVFARINRNFSPFSHSVGPALCSCSTVTGSRPRRPKLFQLYLRALSAPHTCRTQVIGRGRVARDGRPPTVCARGFEGRGRRAVSRGPTRNPRPKSGDFLSIDVLIRHFFFFFVRLEIVFGSDAKPTPFLRCCFVSPDCRVVNSTTHLVAKKKSQITSKFCHKKTVTTYCFPCNNCNKSRVWYD